MAIILPSIISPHRNRDTLLSIDGGVLRLKTYNISSNGYQVTPKAWIYFVGARVYTDFATVTAKAAMADPTYTPVVSAIEFDGANESKAAVTLNYGSTGGTTDIGIDEATYQALPQDNFAFTANGGVTLRFKTETTTNELEVVVPKGTVAGSYTPTAVVKVSNVQNFTVTPTITVQVTGATYTFTYDTQLTFGSVVLKPNLAPSAKPTSLNFTMNIPDLFSNYQAIVTNAEAVGARVQLLLTDPVTGVSLTGNVLKVDNTYSNPASAAIIVTAKVVAKNAAGVDVELGIAKSITFTLTDPPPISVLPKEDAPLFSHGHPLFLQDNFPISTLI